jgi:aspartyl-tRNA(Asn)/glutamyl-tRNA(Gln) amidotransferase subunit C
MFIDGPHSQGHVLASQSMPSISQDDVARIAELARLALTDEELQLYARQLAGILDYAEQLREVDTTGVTPTSHPLAITAPLREDEVRPSLPRHDSLRGAPEADAAAGLFKVPRVIGG